MKVCEGALIFLLGLSAFAASIVAPTKAELEAIYAAAAHEVNAGHYRDALQKLDAIDARQPDMAAAQNLRGVALMRLGDYGRAETALRKAREIDPEFWEARFNLAEVPFLRKGWAEARRRFEELAEAKSEQAQGATGDLIQFKILLTYLLEGKENKAAKILEQLQTSSASPAYYCGKAALAFRQRSQTDAKLALKAAEKSFSPQLNKLFVESFYEIGWMEKPDGAVSAALEVDSLAERVARAQADFRKAEQAYRHGDYENALQSLDQLDATAPNQAVSYNLRGKILLAQGEDGAAEAALRNALVADPQFEEARYNLARIPFKKRDYEGARQQLEALLGATSGGKQARQREQLIQYQIFLTLLLDGRDGPAQKAMDEFKMMDDTPALYYAQAAWAFRHGNTAQGNNWIANAGNLFPEDLNQAFATPFADLGWLSSSGLLAAEKQAPLAVGPTPGSHGTVVSRDQPPDAQEPGVSIPKVAVGQPEFTPAPATLSAESPATVVAQTDGSKATSTPEASPTPEKIASERKSNANNNPVDQVKNSLTSPARKSGESARANRKSLRSDAGRPVVAAKTPAAPEVSERPRQNFGEKVVRFLSYPFQRRNEKPPNPAPAPASSKATKSASPEPTRPKN